jgi:hypothetical protein
MSSHDDAAAIGTANRIAYFGESIVYGKNGGTERTIKAIVRRDPPADQSDTGGRVPRMRIEVMNGATSAAADTTYGVGGVTPAELNTGGDYFTFAYKRGGTAEKHFICARPSKESGAMLVLDLD